MDVKALFCQRVTGFYVYNILIIYLRLWWSNYTFSELEQDVKTSWNLVCNETNFFLHKNIVACNNQEPEQEEADLNTDELESRLWITRMVHGYWNMAIGGQSSKKSSSIVPDSNAQNQDSSNVGTSG